MILLFYSGGGPSSFVPIYGPSLLTINRSREGFVRHGGMPLLLQQTPTEKLQYGFDYTDFLAEGELIEVPQQAIVDPATNPPLSVLGATSVGGQSAFLLGGGIEGTYYRVTVLTRTTYQTLVDVIAVLIASGKPQSRASAVVPYGFVVGGVPGGVVSTPPDFTSPDFTSPDFKITP